MFLLCKTLRNGYSIPICSLLWFCCVFQINNFGTLRNGKNQCYVHRVYNWQEKYLNNKISTTLQWRKAEVILLRMISEVYKKLLLLMFQDVRVWLSLNKWESTKRRRRKVKHFSLWGCGPGGGEVVVSLLLSSGERTIWQKLFQYCVPLTLTFLVLA